VPGRVANGILRYLHMQASQTPAAGAARRVVRP
jgi:hypothetical protein